MPTFQKTVLVIATIILVITLIFVGVALSYSKDTSWPPMTPACPDYWLLDGSGNDANCINVKNLGTCPSQTTMNFNGSAYTGSDGLCAKYTWANNCGLSWDGVTYGINNPCQTSA
jgi:hypothetical protein